MVFPSFLELFLYARNITSGPERILPFITGSPRVFGRRFQRKTPVEFSPGLAVLRHSLANRTLSLTSYVVEVIDLYLGHCLNIVAMNDFHFHWIFSKLDQRIGKWQSVTRLHSTGYGQESGKIEHLLTHIVLEMFLMLSGSLCTIFRSHERVLLKKSTKERSLREMIYFNTFLLILLLVVSSVLWNNL